MPRPTSKGRKGIRRIAISTGGGDAPGLNAVIRAVVLAAPQPAAGRWSASATATTGCFLPEQYPDGGLIPLTPERVRGITHLGGTILGTTNAGNPLKYPVRQPDGTMVEVDRTDELVQALARHGIDALVAVGGDGSLTIANALAQEGPARRRRAEDDRQRPRQDGDHLRLRHRRLLRHRVHRPAALDRGLAPARDGGRGDGPLRRLDRAQRRRLRHRRRDPDPRDPLRPRRGGREDPRARRARARASRSSWWPRARSPKGGALRGRSRRRPAPAERLGGVGERVAARARQAHRAARRASWCWGTCCAAARRPPSTG